MLVSKRKGFNHSACEGVVSLISYTLVFGFLQTIFAALVSLVPVCSDQAFQRGMKAVFPDLEKEKKKEKRSKKGQKRLLQCQVFKVPSLACIPEMKRKLNIVFSKGLFLSLLDIDLSAKYWNRGTWFGAWLQLTWSLHPPAFDFHRELRAPGMLSTSKAPVLIVLIQLSQALGKHQWSDGALEQGLGGCPEHGHPQPWVLGVQVFTSKPSFAFGCGWSSAFPPACHCTRQ